MGYGLWAMGTIYATFSPKASIYEQGKIRCTFTFVHSSCEKKIILQFFVMAAGCCLLVVLLHFIIIEALDSNSFSVLVSVLPSSSIFLFIHITHLALLLLYFQSLFMWMVWKTNQVWKVLWMHPKPHSQDSSTHLNGFHQPIWYNSPRI